jgi:long-chain acyl-CoA synthetase
MTDAGNPFAVVEEDVLGVRLRVFARQPRTLREIWDTSEAHSGAIYLVYGDERLTFTKAHQQVRALAHRLRHTHGVQQGDRVAIATRNYPEWAIVFWATVSIGAVSVPLNAWWTGPELAYGLADSGAVVVVADGERVERLEPDLGDTAVRATLVVRSNRVPAGGEPFFDAVAGEAPPLPSVDIGTDDDAAIMYTSGTTGRPKGAVSTHRNFGAYLMNAVYRAAMASRELPAAPGPQATLLTFPLFHVGGLQSFLVPFTVGGGKIVLMYRWDPAEAIELIEREQVTSIGGVPTTVFRLLETAAQQGRSLPSLTAVSAGATLVPPELVRRIDAQFASRAAPGNGYGLTETSGAAIVHVGSSYVAHPDSVGRPIAPVMELRIAGPDGSEVPTGEVGEIWLKGPTVVRGYLDRPEETAVAFTDVWFHTGDLGHVDEEGLVYVVDRLKDVVIRGSENVYAAEVEAALYEHPDVAEAAIVGIPHERLGEEVGAVVRVRDGATLATDDVRSHVAGRLAAFKVPTRVWITTDELPRNAAGKVLKRQLRDSLAVRT